MNTRTAEEVSNELKNLAYTVGLKYENDETPDEIILAIEEELEAQIDDAENNPQALSTLMGYYNKLNTLDELLDEIQFQNNSICNTFKVISNME